MEHDRAQEFPQTPDGAAEHGPQAVGDTTDALLELRSLAAAVRTHLQWLRAGGVTGLPRPVVRPRVAPDRIEARIEARGAGNAPRDVPPREARSAAVIDREARSAAVIDREARSAAVIDPRDDLGPPDETVYPWSRAAEPPAPTVIHQAPVAARPLPVPVVARSAPRPQGPSVPDPLPVVGQAGLELVQSVLGNCQRCKLCHGRNNLVFGQGDAGARLVFVGEGPGAEEDRTGLAFVGAAGDLLTKMIGAMGFSREQVYICNVVKCRPPGNRTPEPDEMETCGPFLRGQLQALRPQVIVALGRTPAQFLLKTAAPIGRLRGRFAAWEGIPVMPTFHPAYLLRTPSAKRQVWEDLQLVMAELKKIEALGAARWADGGARGPGPSDEP